MNSFLPRLRSCSYNRNNLYTSVESKQVEKDEQSSETDKDIRKKANSDKASHLSAQQQQKACEFGSPQQINVVQNKQRTASVGRKNGLQRADANSNTNQLFNMLSSQRSREVKSIETQRSKISDNIRNRQNMSVQKQNINNQETIISSCGEKTDDLNNIQKNSFIKYPYQIGGYLSSSNNKNNNLLINSQQNHIMLDENLTCKSNSTNTLNNENIDQVYQFYTGFENENFNQNCFYPPITKITPYKYNKDSKTSGTSTDIGSFNEFNSEHIQLPMNNTNQKLEGYLSSNNEIDNNQNSQNTTTSTKQYHKHKFVVSEERRNKEKVKNENTPPKSQKLVNNFNSNSSSKSTLQRQSHQRSISQNYHLYNPNTIQNKYQNSQGNSSSNTTSPGTGSNSEAGEYLNNKNYQFNQINTQTMVLLDNFDIDGQQSISSKRKTIQQNNQIIINEPSSEKNCNMEKVGQKSVIMKVGKKMIKILNPYKQNTGDNKNNINVEQSNSDQNRKRSSSNYNQNSASDGSPEQSKSNEDLIKIEQQNPTIINCNNLVTPNKLQNLPFYFHFNQAQKSSQQKLQIRIKETNEEFLKIHKKELNNYYDKTTDSSSKENQMNNANVIQTDSQDTQDEEEYKSKKPYVCETNNKNVVQANYKQIQKYTGKQKYQILKQNQYINQCFDTPILKPAHVQRKKAPQQNINVQHINDINTIMSESQDSFNLDDQLSVVGGNCDIPSLASTIRSIVQEMSV